VQRYTNKIIDPRTAARLPQTLAMAVLTERGRGKKEGRGTEEEREFVLYPRKKKKYRHLRGVVCMVMCSIVYVGLTLPTGDI